MKLRGLLAAQPTLSGEVDEPDEFLMFLRLLGQCGVSGRLQIRADGVLTEVLANAGRIVEVVRGEERGARALSATLSASELAFELHPWAPPSGEAVFADDVLAEMWEPRAQRGRLVARLVREVREQVSSPVDELQLTALLESRGITDEVAAQRYAASDVFGLAEDVLSGLWRSAGVVRG
jgi:hypothetical protein